MGAAVLMGIEDLGAAAVQAGSGAEAIMAGALDPMLIDPIMLRSIIRFGDMVQPIGKQSLEFCMG